METRDIEIFLALCEERHFGRTAGRLMISQSGVSQVIQRMEREIGAQLFERTSRSVVVTPLARRLRDELQVGYEQIQSAVAAAVAEAGGIGGTLTLGAMGAIGHELGPVLAAYHDRFPRSRVAGRLDLFDANVNGCRR